MTTEMCQPQGYVVDQNAVIRFTYYALFTHPLRLIAHQFARLGSSFFDYLHTPKLRCRAAITGAAQKTCGGPGYVRTQHNKMNGFRLPLFNICGSTFSNASFSVASAFLSSEDTESFK